MDNLTLKTKNTWCPGCGNFPLFDSLKKAMLFLEKKNQKRNQNYLKINQMI